MLGRILWRADWPETFFFFKFDIISLQKHLIELLIICRSEISIHLLPRLPQQGLWEQRGGLEPKPTALRHEAKSPAHCRADIQRQTTICMVFHTQGQFRVANSPARLWSVGGQQTQGEAMWTCVPWPTGNLLVVAIAIVLTTSLGCFSRQEGCCKNCFWQIGN